MNAVLALTTMSSGWQAVFYIAAVVCLVLAALGVTFGRVSLVALGLALAFFVFAWNALAAA